ncbi:nucleotide sugar dehydrogenase [Natronomonas salina]|uniref:nucleotide sugar dehydrogenase n=1 Tax=Natronomonas salina TaxID=1710540 RepID=UPI0015B748DA|nr:nucleotide sugar dehydrogenase [Natronomonas salina]QLD88764.1 nucleotide sugar dehydrogenase [Natronomonas salina]
MSSDGVENESGQGRTIEKINVIGTGFIGLPLALQLAYSGKTVVGVDIDENLVKAINDQSLHLDEQDLQRLLESEEVEENLIAKTSPEEGDAFVISVPTPLTHPQKSPDLSAVEASIDSIIPHLSEGDIVNVESTIPPLTCDDFIVPKLSEAGFDPGVDVHLAHSPERILPGNVFKEIVHNDRVIGGITPESAREATKIYAPFLKGEVHHTDMLSAELCKLMENTYRDVNIALANEFALIGDELDKDMTDVIDLANKHPRVDILRPGIGVGGHCLPIDPWFLNEVDPEHTNLITTARRINDMMPQVVTRKIRHALRDYDDPKLLVLGAAYKPDTQDARESPAREIVEELRQDGYDIAQYDRFIDGMGYDDLGVLIDEIEPVLILQLVDHTETTKELERLKNELVAGEIDVLPIARGNPLLPTDE